MALRYTNSLTIQFNIQYKLAVLPFIYVHGKVLPPYLADEFLRSSDLEAQGRLR